MTTFRTSLISASLNQSSSAVQAVATSADIHNPKHTTRTTHTSYHPALPLSTVKSYPIPLLDALVSRHFRATQSAPLSLSGTHLPLIYKLVATLIASPLSKAVVVIDIDARFDITRVLQCASYPPSAATDQTAPDPESPDPATKDASAQQHLKGPTVHNSALQQDRISATHEQRVAIEDLRHIHVYRPARGSPSHIRDVLSSAEHFIIYSKHASVAREWWGTIVIGGASSTALGSGHADVTTGWKGWLRVDREEVPGFPVGMSAEEALADRDQRQRAAEASEYTATCAWGNFNFREAGDK